MELPKISLNGLKSRLGIADEQARDDAYDDEYYDDEYADDAAYDDGYGDGGYDDYAPNPSYYEPYGEVSTRPARSASSSSSYESSRKVSSPRLVSIDDVKASTPLPDYLNRDPLPERHVTSARDTATASYTSSTPTRTLLDSTAPAPFSPADTAKRKERTESLNSLFESTTPAAEPADSYAAGSSVHVPSRGVQVMKPVSYNEAERIAKILRAGDVAVISLRNTQDATAKRILDFSFGVACALDARVDCISDKVFVLNKGAELTDSERFTLRTQGVL